MKLVLNSFCSLLSLNLALYVYSYFSPSSYYIKEGVLFVTWSSTLCSFYHCYKLGVLQSVLAYAFYERYNIV